MKISLDMHVFQISARSGMRKHCTDGTRLYFGTMPMCAISLQQFHRVSDFGVKDEL